MYRLVSMTSNDATTRRRSVLRAVPAILLGGPALAGCSSSGATSGDPTTESDDGDGGADGGDAARSFDGWFDETENYDGVVDETGESEVTVRVGAADAEGGPFAFAPAAVRVSTGTEVAWKWTGKGSSHNVVSDGNFESDYHTDAGVHFSQTFDSAGTVEYYCTPHKSMGMRGVVVVE